MVSLREPIRIVSRDRLALQYECQGTDRYNELRRHLFAITASEVPDIFGYGYGSRHKLWEHKTGRKKQKHDPFVQEMLEAGSRHEEPLVQQLLRVVGGECFVTGCWTYDKDPRIGASPDRRLWRDGRWYAVEAKSRQAQGGEPLLPNEKFWLQIQTQLAVLDYESAYYISNNLNVEGSVPIVCEIMRDRDCWDFLIYPQICFFIAALEDHTEPPLRQMHKTNFMPYIEKTVYKLY